MSGNAVSLKSANKLAILRCFLKQSPLTKAEVAHLTQLTFATVSNLLTELQAEGWIQEAGYAQSNGGRKPVLYAIRSTAAAFIGISLQLRRLTGVLTDLCGRVLAEWSEPFDFSDGPQRAVADIQRLCAGLLEATGVPPERVAGIGVSAPGPVDTARGIITSPPNMPGWRNVPLRDMIQTALGWPCCLEKDANAAAFGESQFGAGREAQHLLYVMVDAGIGSGMVLYGSVYRGFSQGAGEIGHMVVDPMGPICNCGNAGCLEAVASGLALEREVRARTGVEFSFDHVDDIPLHDREWLEDLLAHAGTSLGVVIGNVCNLLNPQMVVLGGPLVTHSDTYFERARAAAREHILPDFAHQIAIRRSELGDRANAVGAAALALERLLFIG